MYNKNGIFRGIRGLSGISIVQCNFHLKRSFKPQHHDNIVFCCGVDGQLYSLSLSVFVFYSSDASR